MRFHRIKRVFLRFLIFSTVALFSFHIFNRIFGRVLLTSYNDSREIGEKPSFAQVMKHFPWEEYEQAVNKSNESMIIRHSNNLFEKLLPYLRKPPKTPINQSCVAPPLKIPDTIKCNHLERPRKVGVLVLFAFELDALEVHLNELDAVVDKFFIVESIRSHSGVITSKPLMWETLKHDERYTPFASKIVHFIMDDATSPPRRNRKERKLYAEEMTQVKLRWSKFLEWNAETKYFGPSDLLGLGDVDQIPNRDNIYALKHCAFDKFPIDIGIWFPLPYLHTIFRPDYPLRGHPYTLGDPPYWTLEVAVNYSKHGITPNKRNGKSPAFLLGGIHMSHYAYPPFEMTKRLCSSSADDGMILRIIRVGKRLRERDYSGAAKILNSLGSHWKNRTEIIAEVRDRNEALRAEMDQIVKVPWFIQCNPKRYPNLWEDGYDSRLDD